jgi:hypothetical protein
MIWRFTFVQELLLLHLLTYSLGWEIRTSVGLDFKALENKLRS